jgi:hypothetical protein
VCEQTPEIVRAHEKASLHSECGVNWHEFIETADCGLKGKAQEWWDSISMERRLELLKERADGLRETLEAIDREIMDVQEAMTNPQTIELKSSAQ